MNTYKKAVNKHLNCGGARKKELMMQFDASLSAFVEEQTSPSYDQAVVAFGPPEVMAQILMEQVPEREIRQYRTHRRLLKALAYVCATTFIAFTLYIFFVKEFSNITVIEEVYPNYVISSESE